MRYSWLNRFSSQNPDTGNNRRIPYSKPPLEPLASEGSMQINGHLRKFRPIGACSVNSLFAFLISRDRNRI